MVISKFRESVIDRQFEMIGVKFRFADIPVDGMIEVGKKKKLWYEYYKFKDMEQYKEWKKFVLAQMNGNEQDANELDFAYGMNYEYKKEENGSLPF